jgi:hypothetical protein
VTRLALSLYCRERGAPRGVWYLTLATTLLNISFTRIHQIGELVYFLLTMQSIAPDISSMRQTQDKSAHVEGHTSEVLQVHYDAEHMGIPLHQSAEFSHPALGSSEWTNCWLGIQASSPGPGSYATALGPQILRGSHATSSVSLYSSTLQDEIESHDTSSHQNHQILTMSAEERIMMDPNQGQTPHDCGLLNFGSIFDTQTPQTNTTDHSQGFQPDNNSSESLVSTYSYHPVPGDVFGFPSHVIWPRPLPLNFFGIQPELLNSSHANGTAFISLGPGLPC